MLRFSPTAIGFCDMVETLDAASYINFFFKTYLQNEMSFLERFKFYKAIIKFVGLSAQRCTFPLF
jgi:hypothetical protein